MRVGNLVDDMGDGRFNVKWSRNRCKVGVESNCMVKARRHY